jgi:putative Mg2+ transporter-C (MgtC) family protein
MPEGTEKARIAAQVVSGIGFLGAGVIVRQRGQIAGLTTAATIWAAAAVGLAISFGMYLLACITALLLFGVLELHHSRGWEVPENKNSREEKERRD